MIQLKRILVPVDFSPCSEKALRYAVALAGPFDADLDLLHVVEGPVVYGPSFVPPEDWLVQSRVAAREELEKLPGDAANKDMTVHRTVRTGTPFLEIIYHAKENSVDLIIMGTHGRSGLAHLLMGSVAERVVRKAPCPVLTVRDPEHEFVMP